MSLPFADKPEESSIYQDLRVTKLADLTADDFDAFRVRMDAQGTDGLEDEYRRLLLLGLASSKLSVSGPIPGGQKVISHQFTDSEFQSSSTDGLVFSPEGDNEVWLFQGASIGNNTGGANVYYRVGVAPTNYVFGTTAVIDLIDHGVILLSYNSSSDYFPLIEADTNSEPTYITKSNPMFMYTTGATGTIDANFGFIRVR